MNELTSTQKLINWLKTCLREHTFMTSTKKGKKGSGGFLKFVTCLRILLFLNNISIVHFCGCWWWGFKKLVIFCGSHKWTTLTLEVKFGDNALLMNHESNLYSCFTKVIKIRFLKKISFADQLKVFSTYSQKAIKEKKDNEESNIHE